MSTRHKMVKILFVAKNKISSCNSIEIPPIQPPKIPIKILSMTRIGKKSIDAIIFGKTKKYDAEFIPIISKASICSDILMLPISDAIFDPTLPAKISAIIVGENSNMSASRVTKPIRYFGINGSSILIAC